MFLLTSGTLKRRSSPTLTFRVFKALRITGICMDDKSKMLQLDPSDYSKKKKNTELTLLSSSKFRGFPTSGVLCLRGGGLNMVARQEPRKWTRTALTTMSTGARAWTSSRLASRLPPLPCLLRRPSSPPISSLGQGRWSREVFVHWSEGNLPPEMPGGSGHPTSLTRMVSRLWPPPNKRFTRSNV